MDTQRRLTFLLLLTIALLALLVLASGLSQITMSTTWENNLPRRAALAAGGNPDQGTGRGLFPEIPLSILQLLSLSITILVPLTLLLALLSREIRRAVWQDLRRVIFFAAIIAAFLYLREDLVELMSRQTLPPGAAALPGVPGFITNPPALLAVLVGLFLFSLMVAGAWFLWRRREGERELGLIAAGAEETLARLQAGEDFRSAIIRYYFRMCEILREERRIERNIAMTPSEFARRLDRLGLGGPAVDQLTLLFEAVRYGQQQYDRTDEERAVACLGAIADRARRGRGPREAAGARAAVDSEPQPNVARKAHV